MAVDLAAIRRKIQELSTGRKTSSVQLWKPAPGEYKVRGLPLKVQQDGLPFVERWFYYLGDNRGILSPQQFGKPDPINDLIKKLYSSGKPEDRQLAKELHPKMRTYMPLIVRGDEAKGPQIYSFGKMVYNRLLSFFDDEEVGDFLDPTNGFDLKVVITQSSKKQSNGQSYNDTVIDAARRPSKLCDDQKQMQIWLDSVPNIDDMYQLKSTQEIETVLNNWLNGDTTPQNPSDGQSRGAEAVSDELDALANDLKSPVSAVKTEKVPEVTTTKVVEEAPKVAKKPAAKKAVADDEDDVPVNAKKNLDDAFQDLMKDDE